MTKPQSMRRARIVEKLHPRHYPRMSGQMVAIVGCILGERFTNPAIAELHVTSDGYLLVRHEGDIGANDFIGTYRDLRRNWESLKEYGKLTAAENDMAETMFDGAVTHA